MSFEKSVDAISGAMLSNLNNYLKGVNMEDNQESESASQASRPAASFGGSGGIKVAVWKNKSESGYDNYSVRIDRTYKDDSGTFKTTQYLRDSDLLRTERLLQVADDWIEQDKAKQRGASDRPQQSARG
jgi:hypothetical protein